MTGGVPGVLVAVSCLAVAVLTGCAGEVGVPEADGPGVVGRAALVDDTGMPDRAAGGGAVVALPPSAGPMVGYPQEGAMPQGGFGAVVPAPEQLDALGAIRADVDGDGWFRFEVSGEQLLCWMPEGSDTVNPYQCVVAVLPESGGLLLTWGEAGLRAKTS